MVASLRLLACVIGAAGFLFAGRASPALAAPRGAIPVHCTVTVTPGEAEQVIVCRRATERVSYFGVVPSGFYLHVTDVVATPNYATLTGSFRVAIGRFTSGGSVGTPYFQVSGEASRVNALHFTTPYVVLEPGESLGVSTQSNSDFPVNVHISGYLAGVVAP